MQGTRWKTTIGDCVAALHRELKVMLTRVPRPEKWVFVVGCYNSGTTLLAELLGAHSQIGALPTEGQYLTDQWASDHELGLSRMWVLRQDLYGLTEEDRGPDVTRIKKEWGSRLDTSRPVLLEKTPANAARTRWLQKHFENAHFIGILRNGYAVAEGIRRKARPPHRRDGWSLEECAFQWRRSNEVLEADSHYLRHFLWVRYENLTAEPRGELLRLLDFLGLGEDPHMHLERDWSIHERSQPIQDLNAESIARLTREEIDTIAQVAGDLLARFGYPIPPADRS